MVFPEGMDFFGDCRIFRANKLDFSTNGKGIHAVVYMISLVIQMWPVDPIHVSAVQVTQR